MSINQLFIEELKAEMASTKKMLERVPLDKADWKPHDKSMSLGRLATHVAEMAHWITDIMSAEELDFATASFSRHVAATNDELVTILEQKTSQALKVLENCKDEDFSKTWTMKRAGQVVFANSKSAMIRRFGCNHLYHHRGQLSVYLRLLDVPVPGMYGPTADELAAARAAS